ncbi:MAG: AAA family ATPase [Gammaproteobacteria bacterium]|nr:AAA family ATPase [Gammaproteobacteria bacterium]MCF6230741.1 AAA family ATPase [Gammaproteobacteria bacterium]
MNHRVSELFSCGQIRLAELSVCNWGSFHGLHTARIDPEGTLITGDNGAGKSTLIDGLMALLLSSKASFNMAAAQGDRSDRSLVSYIRGSHGLSHDGAQTKTNYKREGAVVSGLRAMYRADDGSVITLVVMFWNTKPTSVAADFKRIYLVAKRNLSLEELLKVFGEGEARQLKKVLRDDPLVKSFDAFNDYQAYYRDCLHMDNRNAPNLLSRALGLKKIDDLTTLIRDLVLEPNNIRDDARNTVAEFDDLVATHQQLLDARSQHEKLCGLPEIENTLHECQQQIELLSTERDGLSIYFGEICADLWRQRIAKIEHELAAVRQKLAELRRQEEDATGQVEQRHVDYVQAGGDRVEAAKDKLTQTKRRLSEVSTAAGKYQKDAREASLDDVLIEDAYVENQKQIQSMQLSFKDQADTFIDALTEAGRKLYEVKEKLDALQKQILGIEAHPGSNIDFAYQKLRDDIVDSLTLDKESLMFVGELIDVKPDQISWHGAIERVIGGRRTALIVPEDCYRLVTRWLNDRHTGLNVTVQVAWQVSGQTQFKADGYLRKLAWLDHPYREWLKHYLARTDLHCVDSAKELNETPFSMTREGLFQYEKGRFNKNDRTPVDNRRSWQLGFSNKSRLSILKQDERALKTHIELLDKAVSVARKKHDNCQSSVRLWQKLAEVQWDEIDVPRWQHQTEQAQAALDNLTRSGSDLEKAQQAWDEAKERLKAIQSDKDSAQKTEGMIESRLVGAQSQLDNANRAAAPGLAEGVREALQKRVAEQDALDIDRVTSIEAQQRRDIESELDRMHNKRQSAQNRAIGIISSFRSGWEVLAAEWGADMRSLPQYLEHLSQLEEEGLPALVEQFQVRLTKCALQSLAGIRSSMDSEREEINDRIDTINRVLKRTEFRQGSHLKLRTQRDSYPHVDEFNRQLTRVLGDHSDDDEARFQQLKSVIEILDKASNPATANTLESQRLLDPRFQLSFFAEELDSQNGDVRDVLHSSSGKSGGEKESFAGTIVAASLAYVLTPDGYDHPVYSTVFLDEAFSNTAETVSRRVLRVFQELKIHVNLITPYKNLNLARESARSLLIAERNSSTHESHLCEVTWEEVDRRLSQHRQNKIKRDAQAMGVEL